MKTEWTLLSHATSGTGHTCATPGDKGCRGCRWFETRLLRQPHEGDWEYKLEIVGKSVVPGEVDRVRVERTTSANAIVDFLALGEPGRRYIPKVSRMVLHEAADIDDAIGDALDDFDSMATS